MYYLRAYNAQGKPLHDYRADTGEYVLAFAECDTYDTAVWATSPANALASGYRQRTQSAPVGVRTEWVRNRIEYFEIWHGSIMLARVERYRERGVNRTRVTPMAGSDAERLRGEAPARSALSPQWGPVAAREAASVAQDDMAERIRRGSAWLDAQIPGWRDMIDGTEGYTADQLARIADGADSQGNRAAVPWIQECARVKAERANRFEVNPYWGDLDDILVILVRHAETGAYGLAVHGGDGTGRADGRQVDFVTGDETLTVTTALYPALRTAGYDEGKTFIANYYNALTVSVEEWDRLADAVNWPSTSEKYRNGLAERLSDTSEFTDDTMGDVEGFGHFALFKSDRAILQTDNFGFVGVTRFDTEALTQAAWESLAQDYERHCLAGMEDALPTSECGEVFLIFDTARHANSVPDRDEIREHVHQCRICLPYRYTLDEF